MLDVIGSVDGTDASYSGTNLTSYLNKHDEFSYDWDVGRYVYIFFLSAIFMGTIVLEGCVSFTKRLYWTRMRFFSHLFRYSVAQSRHVADVKSNTPETERYVHQLRLVGNPDWNHWSCSGRLYVFLLGCAEGRCPLLFSRLPFLFQQP